MVELAGVRLTLNVSGELYRALAGYAAELDVSVEEVAEWFLAFSGVPLLDRKLAPDSKHAIAQTSEAIRLAKSRGETPADVFAGASAFRKRRDEHGN